MSLKHRLPRFAGTALLLLCLLAILPADVFAGNDGSSFFKLGLGSVDDKLGEAGKVVLKVFRAVVFLLGSWRFVMFLKEKNVMELVYVIVSAAGFAFAPELIGAIFEWGGIGK